MSGVRGCTAGGSVLKPEKGDRVLIVNGCDTGCTGKVDQVCGNFLVRVRLTRETSHGPIEVGQWFGVHELVVAESHETA